MRRAALAVGLCWALGGCASGRPAGTPRTLVLRFATAARGGDVATLYALLPERHRRRESLEAFRARLAGDRAELTALGDATALALSSGSGPQAEVTLRDRTAVMLVDDPAGWSIADPGFGPPAATRLAGMAGARAAVRALHVALVQRGVAGWREVLSTRALGAATAEVALLAAATEDPSALDASDFRTRVTFTLPDGRLLDVAFEQGAWRVDGVRDP